MRSCVYYLSDWWKISEILVPNADLLIWDIYLRWNCTMKRQIACPKVYVALSGFAPKIFVCWIWSKVPRLNCTQVKFVHGHYKEPPISVPQVAMAVRLFSRVGELQVLLRRLPQQGHAKPQFLLGRCIAWSSYRIHISYQFELFKLTLHLVRFWTGKIRSKYTGRFLEFLTLTGKLQQKECFTFRSRFCSPFGKRDPSHVNPLRYTRWKVVCLFPAGSSCERPQLEIRLQGPSKNEILEDMFLSIEICDFLIFSKNNYHKSSSEMNYFIDDLW